MWQIDLVLSEPKSIESCMLHCAISTTVKDITDLINLLELIVIMMFGINNLYCLYMSRFSRWGLHIYWISCNSVRTAKCRRYN